MLVPMPGPTALRVPLRWRVMLLLVLLATLNVVFTLLTRSEIAHVTELDRMGAVLVDARRVEERLQAARDNQVLAIRAYALTGDPRFLRDYRAYRREEVLREGRLTSVLEEESALIGKMAEVETAMRAWQRGLADPIIRAEPGERNEVGARLVAGVGDPLFDRVRAAVDELVGGIDTRQAATAASVKAARAKLNRELLAMSALSLLLIAGSVVAMRRWITVPVSTLSAQAKRVAEGELDTHIEAVGPVEFEEIGYNVERMRRRIVSELRAATQAYEALEQRAPLVSSVRAQLRTRTATVLPPGLDVAAAMEPAHGVLAGDWYDVIRIDEHRAALVLVDVSGHGEQAGLRALWLKHLLVPAVRMGLEPGDALNWVAGEVGDTAEWFATCVIIEIDASSGACLFANAGHLPPLVIGSAGIYELPVTGPLFGPLPGQRWHTGETTLLKDEVLVAYTDGIIEARNERGEEFGEERLIACLRSAGGRDTQTITEDVMNTVHRFGSERLKDDATLAVVTCAEPSRSAEATQDADQVRIS